MENQLRGVVLAKFRNISSFARELKWDRKKASRIVNRQQKPTASDMEQMAEALDIRDCVSFVHIFLPSVPTKWESEQ